MSTALTFSSPLTARSEFSVQRQQISRLEPSERQKAVDAFSNQLDSHWRDAFREFVRLRGSPDALTGGKGEHVPLPTNGLDGLFGGAITEQAAALDPRD